MPSRTINNRHNTFGAGHMVLRSHRLVFHKPEYAKLRKGNKVISDEQMNEEQGYEGPQIFVPADENAFGVPMVAMMEAHFHDVPEEPMPLEIPEAPAVEIPPRFAMLPDIARERIRIERMNAAARGNGRRNADRMLMRQRMRMQRANVAQGA